MLKAISSVFSDYAAYAANESDMIIIAKKTGTLPRPDRAVMEIPDITQLLRRIKIESMQDLEIRRIGDRRFLRELLAAFPVSANSDYYPFLDQNAARARFLRANAQDLLDPSHLLLPALDLLTDSATRETTNITPSEVFYPSRFAYASMALRDHCLSGGSDRAVEIIPPAIMMNMMKFKETFCECRPATSETERYLPLINSSIMITSYLAPGELSAVWDKVTSVPCSSSLSASEKNWISLFRATGERDSASMVRLANTLLETEVQMTRSAARYLVAAGMAGSLMQDDRQGAHNLWTTYRSELFDAAGPDLLFQLLAAKSTSTN
ncbi:MAG: hypothetical protein AB1499_13250 [Nitrospirota bacterium]